MPNFNNRMLYGIQVPEKINIQDFVKEEPTIGEISDLIPKNVITVNEVKAAKDVLKRAMKLDPDIKAWYVSKVFLMLFKEVSSSEVAIDGDKMDWCIRQSGQIINLIFNIEE